MREQKVTSRHAQDYQNCTSDSAIGSLPNNFSIFYWFYQSLDNTTFYKYVYTLYIYIILWMSAVSSLLPGIAKQSALVSTFVSSPSQ